MFRCFENHEINLRLFPMHRIAHSAIRCKIVSMFSIVLPCTGEQENILLICRVWKERACILLHVHGVSVVKVGGLDRIF